MEVLSTLTGLVGGGGSATVDQVTLDFGSSPVFSKTFTFTVTGATAGQKVVMSAASDASGEAEMDGFACAARCPSTDTIEASIQAIPGPVTGTRVFNLIRG